MARTMIGKVVSNKMDKTAIVLVERAKNHPIYRKRFTISTRFKAHDAYNTAQIGDVVEIAETRPISSDKRFAITKILEAAPKSEEAKL
ncbi:30S ribosomal protein S17 [bacterium]|nr:30S ribosomal protein S17 [bacterium]